MLQNTRSQTHKISSPSMKPTQIQHQIHSRNTKAQAQEHKPRLKHKHRIKNSIAQIQEHKHRFQHKPR